VSAVRHPQVLDVVDPRWTPSSSIGNSKRPRVHEPLSFQAAVNTHAGVAAAAHTDGSKVRVARKPPWTRPSVRWVTPAITHQLRIWPQRGIHVLSACSHASPLIAKGSVISATLIRSYSAPATYFFSRWHDRQQTSFIGQWSFRPLPKSPQTAPSHWSWRGRWWPEH